ncbi:MAG: UDP-N-acetylmuramoyl-L-alanine--D-glutamate ligase [Acidobacteria bacterium]|nr:UDP-N-acetylmuramoyl-L-alanine--D-glutamate ligase [Acidobacteriota bacterium]MCI0566998.1 UDP-N-acetylmuramoyl-L-alanine--D-glutamate ligase [Acidobacteriota bacterium]
MSGLKFVVVGAGRSGAALARFLLDRGGEVVLTDNRTEGLDPTVGALQGRGARLALGGHDEAQFRTADRVLVSPGVPLTLPAIQAARSSGVPVWGEIEFASRFLKGKIIGITGTNGKSTTTTLTGLLLQEGGLDATTCGNLGTPLIEMVAGDSESRTYVVELSSFQLEGIETFRPAVAVLLNVAPDHQDRYPDHAAYRAAKGRIFENQRPADVAVLNRDNAETFAFATSLASRLSLFSRQERVSDGACVVENQVATRGDGKTHAVLPLDSIPLVGVHNLENVLASVAVADLCGVRPDRMARAIRSFRGLPHRIELVEEIDSVRYYNDSKATNVAATARSLESFARGVILILGGKDKGGDFASLLPLVRQRAAGLVLMGKAREAIAAQLGEPVPTRMVETMQEAVSAASSLASPGQVVLLAPACASFDAYRNFEERGEDFKHRVLELTRKPGNSPGGR